MILLTVGTLFPFDRLVQAIDSAIGKELIEDKVFAQVGIGGLRPQHMEYVEMLTKEEFDSQVQKASMLISHAGIGTITMALEHSKPLLVMPRMRCFREHVNDHQVATARKFEQFGHVLVAYKVDELPGRIERLRTFVPHKREAQTQAVAGRIAQFLGELSVINE